MKDVQETVLRLAKERIANKEISLATPLAELLNSLTYIQFIIACEDEFSIEVDDDNLDMGHFRTLDDVANYISNMLGK